MSLSSRYDSRKARCLPIGHAGSHLLVSREINQPKLATGWSELGYGTDSRPAVDLRQYVDSSRALPEFYFLKTAQGADLNFPCSSLIVLLETMFHHHQFGSHTLENEMHSCLQFSFSADHGFSGHSMLGLKYSFARCVCIS
jgi:hypothetical protein